MSIGNTLPVCRALLSLYLVLIPVQDETQANNMVSLLAETRRVRHHLCNLVYLLIHQSNLMSTHPHSLVANTSS
jgi:hypothetical protein